MSKSNSNKIKLCGGGGQHCLVLNKISTLYFHFLGLLTISKLRINSTFRHRFRANYVSIVY